MTRNATAISILTVVLWGCTGLTPVPVSQHRSVLMPESVAQQIVAKSLGAYWLARPFVYNTTPYCGLTERTGPPEGVSHRPHFIEATGNAVYVPISSFTEAEFVYGNDAGIMFLRTDSEARIVKGCSGGFRVIDLNSREEAGELVDALNSLGAKINLK